MSHVKTLDLTNHKGRVFFTTDLHGCYDLLHEKLHEVSFDSSRDLLILGGDCCDRGPDSKYVLDYLNEPWVHCIQGNHEKMVIDFIQSLCSGDERETYQSFQMLFCNGGEWFFDLSIKEQMDIYQSFKSLPLAFELLLPSEKVGIVHAEVPYGDWGTFKNLKEVDNRAASVAQWARSKYDRQDTCCVEGVDRIIVGHTPTKSGEVEVLGNVWYADLGSFFRSKISFIQLM